MSGAKQMAALLLGGAAVTLGGAWYAYRTAFQADPKRIAPSAPCRRGRGMTLTGR